jgi:hypothetical protein
MKKHTYPRIVLVCTLSTDVEGIQQWITRDGAKQHPLAALR